MYLQQDKKPRKARGRFRVLHRCLCILLLASLFITGHPCTLRSYLAARCAVPSHAQVMMEARNPLHQIVMSVHAALRNVNLLVKTLPAFGFTCGLMGAVSYLCTDMLSLRLFTILNGAIACFFYFLQPQPIWVSIFWNFVFFAINVVQVAMLLAAKGRTFNEKEMALYRHFSHSMSVVHWGMLLSCGSTWKKAEPDEVILKEDDEATRVVIIAEGKVKISKGGDKMSTLGPGAICGEISLMTGGATYTATVAAKGRCEFMEFTHESLKKLNSMDMDVKDAFAKLMSKAMAQKLLDLLNAQHEVVEKAENRMYVDMIRAVVTGVGITHEQKALLEEIREKHDISAEQHSNALNELGLNEEYNVWRSLIGDLSELHRRLVQLMPD